MRGNWLVAAAEVLAINKLKGLGCQNDTGGSIEPQRLFGALSNQGVVVGYCGREGMIRRDRNN
jgi:hypothetical protein